MKLITGLAISFVIIIMFYMLIRHSSGQDESLAPGYDYTYTNTPNVKSITTTSIEAPWWGGNYYYRLDWQPWGYHHPDYYFKNRLDTISYPYVYPSNTNVYPSPGTGPMLTSLDTTPNLPGIFEHIGTASERKEDGGLILDVYQLTVDPSRELYKYYVRYRERYILLENVNNLKSGNEFMVKGLVDKGPFVAKVSQYDFTFV